MSTRFTIGFSQILLLGHFFDLETRYAEKETGQTNRCQLDTKTNDNTKEEEEDGEFQLDEGIVGDHLCVS